MVTVFGRAILGQAAPELLKQVVSVFVAARSRILILSQAVTVFDPIQHTRGKMPAYATGFRHSPRRVYVLSGFSHRSAARLWGWRMSEVWGPVIND